MQTFTTEHNDKDDSGNMRLKLNYVHLVNFRKHADYMFTPADTGITAILGENGHGKSSIIDGIAWALYGVKPSKSLKNTELKRNTAAQDDPCYVEVSLMINDDDELIVNRSIKGKAGTVQCECRLNGKLEAGPAVSNVSKWIPKTIGLDTDGFLSAVLVQQKQVDDIISQSPAVRQANIEKLTGITAATKAVKAARDDANSLKKALALLAPPDNDTNYENIIKESEKELNGIESERESLKTSLETELETQESLTAQTAKMRTDRDAANKLSYEIDGYKSALKILTAQRDELMENIAVMKGSLPSVRSTDELEKQLADAENRLHALQSENAKLEAIANAAPSNEQMESLKTKLAELKNSKPNGTISGSEKIIDDANITIADAKARREQALDSMETLETGEGKCPTCLQPIKDAEHVRKEFNRIINDADKTIKESTASLKTAETMLNALKTHDMELESLETTIIDAESRQSAAVSALKAIDDMKSELKATEKETGNIRGRISDIRMDEMKVKQYDDARRNFTESNNQIGMLEKRIEQAKTELDDLEPVSDRKMRSTETKLNECTARIMEMKSQAVELKGRKALLDERMRNAHDGIERRERYEKQRKIALERNEIAQAGVSVLSGFREHLAKDTVPRITDYASDLMNAITDGKFTSINMDEKYNITVTDDNGKELDVHALSGGEQSAVAISMRLAISEMLSGGDASMLILDEVLTAMDDNRAQSILETIQEAGHGQVIIIAHNDIIRSIADTVTEL